MIIPFGKYKGKELCDIPRNYLLRVLHNCDGLQPRLKTAIEIELGITPPLKEVAPAWSEQSAVQQKPAMRLRKSRSRNHVNSCLYKPTRPPKARGQVKSLEGQKQLFVEVSISHLERQKNNAEKDSRSHRGPTA